MHRELPLNIKIVPGGGVVGSSTAQPMHPVIWSLLSSYSSGAGVFLCWLQIKLGIVAMSLCQCPLLFLLAWLVRYTHVGKYRTEFGATSAACATSYEEIIPLFCTYCPACCIAPLKIVKCPYMLQSWSYDCISVDEEVLICCDDSLAVKY